MDSQFDQGKETSPIHDHELRAEAPTIGDARVFWFNNIRSDTGTPKRIRWAIRS